MSLSQVLNLMSKGVDFISNTGQADFLKFKLPLINRNAAETLGLAADLAAKLEQMRAVADSGGSLQVFSGSLGGIFGADAQVSLGIDGHNLKFSLTYGLEKDWTIPFSLDLSTLIALAGGDTSGFSALTQLVDVSGAAQLGLSVGGSLQLDLGLDLSNPDSPRPFVYDSSNLTLSLRAAAQDLSFSASIGALGIFVRDGWAVLDADGQASTAAPATFTVGLAHHEGGDRHYFDDASAPILADLGSDVSAAAGFSLPVYFPTESVSLGQIQVGLASLKSFAQGIPGSVTITAPSFNSLFGGVNIIQILANPSVVIDGLSSTFNLAQSTLSSVVSSAHLPLVGDSLVSGIRFIGDMGNGLLGELRQTLNLALDGQSPPELIRQALYTAFGPGGLGILQDRDGDGVDLGDVQMVIDTPNYQFIEYDMHLGQTLLNASLPFDLGIEGVPLALNGAVNLAMGWNWDFGFGVSVNQGLYMLAGDEHDLTVSADVTMPQTLHGELFFLNADVTPVDDSGNIDYGHSLLNGSFNVHFNDLSGDGTLSLSSLRSTSISSVISAGFAGTLDARLQTLFSIAGSTAFPRLKTTLDLSWAIGKTFGEPATNTGLNVSFDHVCLDLGSTISGYLKPVFTKVNEIIDPVRPVINLLNQKLPVIDMSLLQVAGAFDPASKYVGFVNTVIWISDTVAALAAADGSETWIDMGSFRVGGAGSSETSIDTTEAADFLTNLDASSASASTKSIMHQMSTGNVGFHLNILQPANIFKLLMGRDITLVSFDVPELNFNASYSQSFPIFGPLMMTLAGEVSARIHLGFGYDTFGIRKVRQTGNWAYLLDGFFISDRVNADGTGAIMPQVTVNAGLFAGAELNLGIASGGVRGGIVGQVDFLLNDPNDDGKVRMGELVGNALQGIEHIFDIDAIIKAQIDWYVKIGFGPFSVKKSGTLASTTLIEEHYSASSTPILATPGESGQLIINAGQYAADRLHGERNGDAGETISITAGGGQTITVTVNGQSQSYSISPGTTLVIHGGEGSDHVVIGDGVQAKVAFEGNGGNDYFEYRGTGTATADGGAGNDTLLGGAGHDSLSGGEGNDSLVGGGGNDTLGGGSGDDTLDGGEGGDLYAFGDGFGCDTLSDLNGEDTADFSSSTSALTLDPNTQRITSLGNDSLLMNTVPELIIGSGDNDTILSRDQDNTWTITGGDQGDYNGEFRFQSFEHLVGNTCKDTFAFQNGAYLSQMIDGGVGAEQDAQASYAQQVAGDLLDFSACSTTQRFQVTELNAGRIYSAYANPQYRNIENITGGSARDYLVFNDDAYLCGLFDGGQGEQNRIDLSDYKLTTVYKYNIIDITGVNSGSVNERTAFQNVQNFSGGTDEDIFYLWPIPISGSYGEGFLHSPDGAGGTLSGAIDGKGDNNRIDNSPVYREPNMLLSEAPALVMPLQPANAPAAAYQGLDQANYDTVWEITGRNSGTRTANGVTTSFSNTQNIVGSAGRDLFIIHPGGSLDGYIEGAGGNDCLVYGWEGDEWNSNVTLKFLTRTQVTTTAIGGYVANFEQFVAGRGADNSLVAVDISNLWTLTGDNAGSLQGLTPVYFAGFQTLTAGTSLDSFAFHLASDGAGDDTLSLAGSDRVLPWTVSGDGVGSVRVPTASTPIVLNFQSIENIVSGNADDTFLFSDDTAHLKGLDAGGGNDLIDLSRRTVPVTINLQTMAMTPSDAFSNAETITGSAGSDTLVGANYANTFNVTAADTIQAEGILFSSLENITGGPDDDRICFAQEGSISGNIDGGGENLLGDTLDYGAIFSDVSVNLQTAKASRINGTFTRVRNFAAGSGDNTLTGKDQANTWNVIAAGTGDINNYQASFTGFDNLCGGSGDDTLASSDDADFTLSDTGFSASTIGDFSLSGFENAVLAGGKGDNRFTVSGWTGLATLDGGDGSDTVIATRDADIVLADFQLILNTGGTSALSRIENAILTGGASDNEFTVSDWTGTATLTGAGGNDTVVASRDADIVLADEELTISTGGTSILSGIRNANLTGGASDNQFTLSGWTGAATLAGGDGSDTVVAARDADFVLADVRLTISSGGRSALSGIENAILTGGAADNCFLVSEWTGTTSLTGGDGSDTVVAARDADFLLADAQLTISTGGISALSSIENAVLAGDVEDNQFTISDWTGAATLDGGNGSDSVVATRDADFTLGDGQLVISSGGTFMLPGVENAILTGGAADNQFTTSDWTGAATLAGCDGNDTLVATRNANFLLADEQLTISTGGTSTLSGIENAILTGGDQANQFTVSDWTGAATLAGAGGSDTVVASGDADFLLANDRLTISGGGVFILSSIENAVLTGGAAANQFTISGWTGVATLAGGEGSDTVIASRDADFVLADERLTISTGGTAALSSIENAVLTGGVANNRFTVSGWTGSATLAGGDGNDAVIATRDSDFALADDSLTIQSGGTVALAGIELATLKGGPSINRFTVRSWNGQDTLDGSGGDDLYDIDVASRGQTVINDSGASKGDRLQAIGGSAAERFTVRHGLISARGRVRYSSGGTGVDSVAVLGNGGNDTFNAVADTVPTRVRAAVGTTSTLNYNANNRWLRIRGRSITNTSGATLVHENLTYVNYSKVATKITVDANWPAGDWHWWRNLSFAVTLSSGAGLPVPSGAVKFLLGSRVVATATLVKGVAKRVLSVEGANWGALIVAYAGNGIFAPCSSGRIVHS
ncbi:MAG: beta strand repeat-containing protein [Bacillota bacterium]